VATEHSFYADHLVDALLEEGIPRAQIWELDGWKLNEQGYYWTNIHTNMHNGYDGVANGHLNHHTASKAYTPSVKSNGKTKATGWLGIRDGDRLYMNRATGIPTICLASAGPADYSAGSGVRGYIKKLDASEAALKQLNRDDDPKFYGNRYVLNTEIICDGIGGSIDPDSWDLLIVYNAALARLHDAGVHWNGFHAGFTRRKIDYRDGRFDNAPQTILAMWTEIAHILGTDPVIPPIEPPIIEPPPVRPPMQDQGRNQLYVKEGMSGQDVEYWQVMSIMAHDSIPFTGVSNRTFIHTHAPQLTWKEWDAAMTTYLSSWTGRNSYGVGATERVMLETAVIKIYAALQ
jgi:hypothetical protein